jgi:shikimate kinase
MMGPVIIVLVGPKGAGKSYLGQRMRDDLGLNFLEVERIWVELKSEGELSDKSFADEGTRRVLARIANALNTNPAAVIIESTGAAPWFHGFLRQLQDLATVEFVKVTAPIEICLQRIEQRDSSIHLPASRELIERTYAISTRVELPWTDVVTNQTHADADAFLKRYADHRRRESI